MYWSGMYAVIILLMAYITASASLTCSPFLSKVVARAILSITSAMYTRENDTYIEDLPSFMMYSRNDPASTPNKIESTIAITKYAATGCDASEVLEALSACETAAAAASVFVLLY
jgi:hypothetical protein